MKSNIKFSSLMIVILFACKVNAAEIPSKDSTSPETIGKYGIYKKSSVKSFDFLLAAEKDPSPSKKFFFSVVLTPDFKGTTIPPVSLYFERGIAGFLSLGASIGASYYDNNDLDYTEATIGIGFRACGYVMPAIATFGDKQVNSHGFDPFAGLTYNYYITAVSDYDEAITSSNFGIVVGTRWYPGNRRGFGLLAEYGTTGIKGGNVRVGITLGR